MSGGRRPCCKKSHCCCNRNPFPISGLNPQLLLLLLLLRRSGSSCTPIW
jgi:hypothetical protein